MNAPLLAVDNLSIVRAETTLLDRVSWRMQPGEHWLVLVTHHVEKIVPVFTHALRLRRGARFSLQVSPA